MTPPMTPPMTRSASLRERDARVIANIARLRFSPLCLIGGRGNRLIEEGGRQLLDLSASFGPAILGYSHPAIGKAVTAACANMAGASLLAYPNENAVALAEDLLRLIPGRGERPIAVHFIHRVLSRQSLGLDEYQRPHRDDPQLAARRIVVAALSGPVSSPIQRG
jgi:4-aminobutyrate aminotransferase-like enzyme